MESLTLTRPRSPRRLARAAALAAVVLTAACRSASSPAPDAVSPDTWAVVDGTLITREAVERVFRRVGSGADGLSNEELLTAKLSLLDELIVEEILLAKARALKLEVPVADVDNAFAEARKNIPEDAFTQELTKRNLTAEDMREGLRRDLLSQKVIEHEVVSKIVVTDQEVTDFFNANRAQFNLPEEAFHLAQIIVTPGPDPQLANRTGDDATTPEAATAKVSMLMERLKQGSAFGDLARDFSEDPESAPRGGDLGLVPISAVKQASPALRDAVMGMSVGSARVVNQGGALSIIYVVAREPAGQRELSTPGVRERISETLRGRREQLLRTAYMGAARADAQVVNYLARRVFETQGREPAAK